MRRPAACVSVAACAAFVAVLACQKSLPTAPSELTEGIVVYEHANYGGASAHIISDIADLKDFKGPCIHAEPSSSIPDFSDVWDDCISSIRVASGWHATVYVDDDFDGRSIDTSADIPNLEDIAGSCKRDSWNDCISSIRVKRR